MHDSSAPKPHSYNVRAKRARCFQLDVVFVGKRTIDADPVTAQLDSGARRQVRPGNDPFTAQSGSLPRRRVAVDVVADGTAAASIPAYAAAPTGIGLECTGCRARTMSALIVGVAAAAAVVAE